MNPKRLLRFAMLAGEIMLRNGAETYRVEDTIERILQTAQLEVIEAFVTPTGIFATIDDPSIEMITLIKRVRQRTIHLDKVAQVNDLSRRFVSDSISLDEALIALKNIEKLPPYSPSIMIASIGLAAAFFTAVFGGNVADFFSSGTIGIFLGILLHILDQRNLSRFMINILGGGVIALLGLLFVQIGYGVNLDKIIIGGIMPLVPGVAITNAVRDTIEGDLVSGISRGIEAFFIAISIATGVGIVLKTWFILIGGVPL